MLTEAGTEYFLAACRAFGVGRFAQPLGERCQGFRPAEQILLFSAQHPGAGKLQVRYLAGSFRHKPDHLERIHRGSGFLRLGRKADFFYFRRSYHCAKKAAHAVVSGSRNAIYICRLIFRPVTGSCRCKQITSFFATELSEELTLPLAAAAEGISTPSATPII